MTPTAVPQEIARMNKTELVAELARRTELTQKDAGTAIDSLLDILADGLSKGDKLTIPGYLTIERVTRKARSGRNPLTGATMEIPEQQAVKISAGSKLKAAAKG
jgi:DNA-binding protein HU-beta